MRRCLLVLVLAGCHAGAVVSPTPPAPSDPCRDVACVSGSSITNKVDLLFVLDDRPTMDVKLAAWRTALPALLDGLKQAADDGSPVSYHLGVITTDLGAGPFTLPAYNCKPGGDGAELRATADMIGGVHYIDDNQIAGTQNVPDIAAALDALSDVGTAGCEFGSPLEAAYRALHDQIAENQGFLRSDAALAVVFVSDVDDCSAAPNSDLFDGSAAGVAKYGPLDHFRCTQFGVACNGAPVPATEVSGLTGCSALDPAAGGQLLGLERYIDFFTKPAAQGGVKVDPHNVILVVLSGPSDPVGVTVTSPCTGDPSTASCATLNHSCVAPNNLQLFGDPAVRLRSVVAAVRNNDSMSICDASDDAAQQALVDMLYATTAVGCLPQPVAARADGTPDCIAEDVTANPDGTVTITELPSCVENGGATPCWRLIDRLAEYDSEGCTASGVSPRTCRLPPTCQPIIDPVDGRRELYTTTVDRGTDPFGNPLPPPPATTTRFTCATIPQ